ncbi:MAG: response regulator [Chloroflexi bacterium]|nr:response regulator [Chloroflexota bacterium]
MPHQILIVDPDEAFGQMLVQMLSLNGDYNARAVSTGAGARAAVKAAAPDLAIIDLSIADTPARSLISDLRTRAPGLRIMLIPLGDGLPDEYREADIQGVLTKPFFIGDLGDTITQALGTEPRALVDLPPPPERKVDDSPARPRVRQIIKSAPADAPATKEPAVEKPALRPLPPARAPAEPIRETPRARRTTAPVTPATDSTSLERVLAALASEVRAEALLVLRDGALAAQRSSLPAQRIEPLIALINRWQAVAGETAALVGEPYGRFRQLHMEGDRHHIYALDAATGLVVVIICRNDVSFGTLRLALKSALADIVKLVR